MASILLPSSPGPRSAKPSLVSFGTLLVPFLGGPSQRINRLGTRWALMVSMAPMLTEPLGRQWVSALAQASENGAIMAVPQDIDVGSPGVPRVSAAVGSGMALPLKGMTAGYQLKEGQFLSIIHGGRRYLHMVTAALTIGAGGTGTAAIYPMLRTALSNNDVVEIAEPMIEGWIDGAFDWSILQSPMVQLPDFTITEAA